MEFWGFSTFLTGEDLLHVNNSANSLFQQWCQLPIYTLLKKNFQVKKVPLDWYDIVVVAWKIIKISSPMKPHAVLKVKIREIRAYFL